eukprot:365006-Chlamydomonas_euryale.AAC.10
MDRKRATPRYLITTALGLRAAHQLNRNDGCGWIGCGCNLRCAGPRGHAALPGGAAGSATAPVGQWSRPRRPLKDMRSGGATWALDLCLPHHEAASQGVGRAAQAARLRRPRARMRAAHPGRQRTRLPAAARGAVGMRAGGERLHPPVWLPGVTSRRLHGEQPN